MDLHHAHIFASDIDATVAWSCRHLRAVVICDGDMAGSRNVLLQHELQRGLPSGRRSRSAEAKKQARLVRCCDAVAGTGIPERTLRDMVAGGEARATKIRGRVYIPRFEAERPCIRTGGECGRPAAAIVGVIVVVENSDHENQDWRSDMTASGRLRMVEVIAPFGGAEAMVADLKKAAFSAPLFAGRPLKYRGLVDGVAQLWEV